MPRYPGSGPRVLLSVRVSESGFVYVGEKQQKSGGGGMQSRDLAQHTIAARNNRLAHFLIGDATTKWHNMAKKEESTPHAYIALWWW